MTKNLQKELQPYLYKKEKLIWVDKPKTGFIFRAYQLFSFPFTIFWISRALSVVIQTFNKDRFVFLASLLFVFVGVGFLLGDIFYDSSYRKHTTYALTNKRIIIKNSGFIKTVSSFNLNEISRLEIENQGGGYGVIYIDPQNYHWTYRTFSNSENSFPPRLAYIKEVGSIYRKIMDQRELVRKA